ncbi:Protein phosphatase 2C family protein [Euphorbia peplus]|nr:Protein phosphatase 2C family protein [Euphorbia peplus]
MGLKDLNLKLKALRLRRFLTGDGARRRQLNGANPSWMTPISHGYHVVEDQSYRGGLDDSDFDSVVVQREQIDELELWFFGVFDARVRDGITKYLQSHLFDRNHKQSQIRRKSKETMRKAYLGARAKIREIERSDDNEETGRVSSASVLVINGEKLVMSNMGDYRAVVCKDGVAHQMSSKHQQTTNRHWSRRLFSVRVLAWKSSKAAGSKQSRSSELVVGAESINADTEFVIVGSTGIWEVMKNQEAVNLIRHLQDPQAAAQCLAKEALIRMSKSNISCIVIRFD